MKNKPGIFQLYIELIDFEPKIWRRIEIKNSMTFAEFAYVLMTLFEIRDYYAYQFKIDQKESYKVRHPEYARHPERLDKLKKTFTKARYGITNKKNIYMYNNSDEEYGELIDATKSKIITAFEYPNDYIMFYYDPEVNWKIKISLEKVTYECHRYHFDLPNILDGNGYGIIELCSSMKQLAEFREKSRDRYWREKSEYKFYITEDKVKKSFNFDKFDVEDLNYRVKKMPALIKERYEKDLIRTNPKILKIEKRRYAVQRKKSKNSIDKTKK